MKIVVAMTIMLSTFSHAEPKESFIFLEKVNKLETLLNISIKSLALSYMFPDKHFLKDAAKKEIEDYGAYMRKAAVSMKSSDSHKILTYLAESKSMLENINLSELNEKKLEELAENSRVIEDEFGNIVAKRLLALSPSQHIRYSLDEISKLAQRASVEYEMKKINTSENKKAQKALDEIISSIDENVRSIKKYQYWDDAQKKIVERIGSFWNIQRDNLSQAMLPLVVDIGSSRIKTILDQLKKTTIK